MLINLWPSVVYTYIEDFVALGDWLYMGEWEGSVGGQEEGGEGGEWEGKEEGRGVIYSFLTYA